MLTISSRRERTWHRTSFRVMGSIGELVLDAPASAVPHAIRRLRALEGTWSRFEPSSELERLHARAGAWVHVSADLAAALRWIVRMHRETAGLFDPTVRDDLERWGYDRTFRDIDASRSRPPARRAGRDLPRAPGDVGVELDRGALRARIEPGVRVDLGGIGKGLAADLVARELVRAGAVGAYVCLGGDVHAAGEPPGAGWPVPLVDPRTGAAFATHVLPAGGLVMSTSLLRRWRCGGVEAHHLIDPRTGAPAQSDVVAVAVASASAARGEALAKAALIAGAAAGTALLRRADVTAWVLTDERVVEIAATDDQEVPG